MSQKTLDLGTLNWCLSLAESIEGQDGKVTAAIGAEIQYILEAAQCPNPTTPEFSDAHDRPPSPSYVG